MAARVPRLGRYDCVSEAVILAIPDYTRAERISDGIIHVAGVVLSIAAVTVLLRQTILMESARAIVAAALYSTGLLATFGFSAAYNLTLACRWNEVLRRCDHSAIYVMIAGTFTPFGLARLGHPSGYLLLALVWLTVGIGVALKFACPRRFERLSLVLYLALGWLSAAGIAAAGLPVPTLLLLLGGGLLYSVGVIFFLRARLRFQNAIWHAFVLAAAICHYAAVQGLLPG